MNALRSVQEITSDTVTVAVPASLLHHKVEILILPLDRDLFQDDKWPAGFLERFAGSIPDFPDMESEGDYESRETLE